MTRERIQTNKWIQSRTWRGKSATEEKISKMLRKSTVWQGRKLWTDWTGSLQKWRICNNSAWNRGKYLEYRKECQSSMLRGLFTSCVFTQSSVTWVPSLGHSTKAVCRGRAPLCSLSTDPCIRQNAQRTDTKVKMKRNHQFFLFHWGYSVPTFVSLWVYGREETEAALLIPSKIPYHYLCVIRGNSRSENDRWCLDHCESSFGFMHSLRTF